MTFWRRVRIYLVGFGLGLVMVYIMFGDRELNSWIPSKRILVAIDSSSVSISDRAKCQLSCLNLSETEWRTIQKTTEVNFSESNTQKQPCPIYHLNGTENYSKFTLVWEVCESEEKVQLLAIRSKEQKCNC